MAIDSEKLIAFADGELEPAERTEIEAAMAADPALRAQIEAHRRLKARLSAAFDPVLEEPLPPRLQAAAEGRPSNVTSLAARRRPRWTAREWGAMAACLAGGLLLGLGAMRTQSPLMETTQDGLVARGALARSLETKLAADTPGAVRIGVSFRDQAGDFCRTFTLTHAQTAGLACKSSDGWRVAMTTHAAAQTSEMRMAGAETPPAIVAAIEASIAGEPFDAAAEARARAARWRAVR